MEACIQQSVHELAVTEAPTATVPLPAQMLLRILLGFKSYTFGDASSSSYWLLRRLLQLNVNVLDELDCSSFMLVLVVTSITSPEG
eukprot:scaffold15824_cov269-Alexandrium_tamarense.AAC.3